MPVLLMAHRDLWPRLLFHPAPEQLVAMRSGPVSLSRIGLGAAVILCSLFTPRAWYPVDPYNEKALPSPEQTASFASYIFSYSWIGGLVMKAFKKDLGPEDLLPIPDYDRAHLWGKKILKDKKKSTMLTLLSLMRYDLAFMTCASGSIGASKFLSPWAMKELLAYIEGSKESVVTPWVYVVLLFIGPLVSACFFEFYVFNSTR